MCKSSRKIERSNLTAAADDNIAALVKQNELRLLDFMLDGIATLSCLRMDRNQIVAIRDQNSIRVGENKIRQTLVRALVAPDRFAVSRRGRRQRREGQSTSRQPRAAPPPHSHR